MILLPLSQQSTHFIINWQILYLLIMFRKYIFWGMIVNDKKGKLTHSTAQIAYKLYKTIDAAYDDNSSSLRKRLDRIMPKAAHGWRLEDVWKEELGEKWETINHTFYKKHVQKLLIYTHMFAIIDT